MCIFAWIGVYMSDKNGQFYLLKNTRSKKSEQNHVYLEEIVKKVRVMGIATK